MWFIGVDAHRALLVAVAVDEAGKELGTWSGRNREQSWTELVIWAEDLAGEAARVWGIEGSGNQGRGLAQLLVGQDEVVFEINPRLTAESRNRSRRRDKSDQADARAITRLLRESRDDLPRVKLADATSPLAILTRERESLQADINRQRNRLHAALLRIDPAYKQRITALTKPAGLMAVLAWDETELGPTEHVQLQAAQRLARRLLSLLDDLETVSADLTARSRPATRPLTTIFGIAELTAGMLAGYLGPDLRFASDAHLAQYAGVAPLEASSAGRTRHRLNRTGHRKLNELIHRIALTQARQYQPAQAYVARRRAEGKTWREAIRALKRYIVRAIYTQWKECLRLIGYSI
jgi:transposase